MAGYNLRQTGAEVQEILDSVETFDTTPTTDSENPVTSGGVKAAIDAVGVVVLQWTYTSNADTGAISVTRDKTFAELKEIIDSGKELVACCTKDEGNNFYLRVAQQDAGTAITMVGWLPLVTFVKLDITAATDGQPVDLDSALL